jgi:hypothetical protein
MRDEYDHEYYSDDEERQPGWLARSAARVSKWIGATLALLVIGGLLLWVYGLGKRDAASIPVIKAAIEPAKVQPDEPGGAVVAHQDITSYSAGTNESAPGEINFAAPPERPTEADVAMGSLQESGADAEGAGTAATAAVEPAIAPPAEPTGVPGTGTQFAPGASVTAPRRPTDLAQRIELARKSLTAEADLLARAAASAVQIQLGAFPDREITKSEWSRIYRANQDILTGRTLVVVSTISGGQRFFRLRVGPFRDRVEAQNVCRALQARQLDCIVAVNG